MNRKRGKYAGNFALLAGNNYSKRKSLPRDIHGFEPVEGYFNRRRDGDSDSSDLSSLDEEVVQKELEKLLRKRRRTKKSLSSPKPQPESLVKVEDTPQQQSPPRRQTHSILRSSRTRYTETPQQTGLTPASAPRGVRSRLTWSDAKDDEAATSSKARHQETPTAPATNTKSRRRSTRRSLAVRNTANDDEEPAKVPSDRVTASDEVPDKVSSDRETVDHISDSDNALSPARQSIVTVTDFNPMQASTANSHQTTRRFTRQSMATFQSLTNVTVASSDSEDEENGDVIRGLLSNSPRALVKLSRAKHSLVEGNSEEQASNVTVTKRRTTRSPKKLLSRQTHASEVSDPSPGRTRASEAGDPPSQVFQAAAEPPSHHVPETSKTVASDKTHSRRTTRQSTRRSTRGKEPESGDDDNTIKLSPFQLSIDQPLPFNFYSSSSRSSHISKAQETTETSAATSSRKESRSKSQKSSTFTRASGSISQSDNYNQGTTETSVASKRKSRSNRRSRVSGSISQSDDDNQETTKRKSRTNPRTRASGSVSDNQGSIETSVATKRKSHSNASGSISQSDDDNQGTTETSVVSKRKSRSNRRSRVSGSISQSDDDNQETTKRKSRTNPRTRASGSISQSDDNNQETTKRKSRTNPRTRASGSVSDNQGSIETSVATKRKSHSNSHSRASGSISQSDDDNQETSVASNRSRSNPRKTTGASASQSQQEPLSTGDEGISHSPSTIKKKRKKVKRYTMPKRKSRANTTSKSEQSTTIGVPRPRKQQRKYRIEETTTEQSQQGMTPERDAGQEYETELNDENAYTDTEEEQMDVTFIGGKKFKRVEIHPRSDITPGVRRSKRRRIAPIQPGEYLEYKLHCGVTPSKSYGSDLQYVLKPTDSGYHSTKRSRVPRVIAEEEDQYMTDPSDGEAELLITTSLSNCTPANTMGEVPSANDDVFIYKLFTGEQYSHGYVQMKRFAEKPKCKLGNNLLIGMVVKGRVMVSINGHEFNVKSHSWFQVPPGSVYGLVNYQRSSAEIYYTVHREVRH